MCVFVLERELMKHTATSVSTHPMENRSALAAHSQSVGVFLTLSLEDFALNLVCQQTISGQLSLLNVQLDLRPPVDEFCGS